MTSTRATLTAVYMASKPISIFSQLELSSVIGLPATSALVSCMAPRRAGIRIGKFSKYRLHGVAAGLVLLAGLFIWKNAFSLVPAHASEQRREYIAGKDAATGFVNLLRRSIHPRDLLAT